MREGLYRVAFHNVHGVGGGVIYACGGKLRGGNSAFAFIGSYTVNGGEISAKVSTRRHTEDVNFKQLFDTDDVTLVLKGQVDGDAVDFEGFALHLPGVTFKSMLTMIEAD